MTIERVQKVRLASLGILLLVLGAGFLMGAAWDRRLAAEVPPGAAADSASATSGERGRRRSMYYQVTPALTPEQLRAAEAITAHRRALAQALFEEPLVDSLYDAMKAAEQAFKDVYDPRFRSLVDSSRSAIKEVMTAEQSRYYDSLLAESDRRRAAGQGEGSEE